MKIIFFESKIEILFYSFHLDRFWIQKAATELGESDENSKTKLCQLKDRIILEKSIPVARRDDAFLLRFLRAKKFDVDQAFRMV